MLPVGVAASTSPSPVNVPVVIETVAPTRLRLSGSLTEAALDSTTAPAPCVKCAPVATFDSVGGSFTLVTPMVVVTAVLRLLELPPLLSTQVTVRAGSAPKPVG